MPGFELINHKESEAVLKVFEEGGTIRTWF